MKYDLSFRICFIESRDLFWLLLIRAKGVTKWYEMEVRI